MIRRSLAEMLAEMVEPLGGAPAAAMGFRFRELAVALPVEVSVRDAGEGLAVEVDAPAWRWRTAFDRQPGRLTLRLSDLAADGTTAAGDGGSL